MLKNFFILTAAGWLSASCVHMKEEASARSFKAPKDLVWRILVDVFKAYPIKTIDESTGYIETKVLTAGRFWIPPHEKRRSFSGYSSVIRVKLSYQKPYSKVFIHKKIYKQKGFISSKEEKASDFLEESALLYQIGKELRIRLRLKKIKERAFQQ